MCHVDDEPDGTLAESLRERARDGEAEARRCPADTALQEAADAGLRLDECDDRSHLDRHRRQAQQRSPDAARERNRVDPDLADELDPLHVIGRVPGMDVGRLDVTCEGRDAFGQCVGARRALVVLDDEVPECSVPCRPRDADLGVSASSMRVAAASSTRARRGDVRIVARRGDAVRAERQRGVSGTREGGERIREHPGLTGLGVDRHLEARVCSLGARETVISGCDAGGRSGTVAVAVEQGASGPVGDVRGRARRARKKTSGDRDTRRRIQRDSSADCGDGVGRLPGCPASPPR